MLDKKKQGKKNRAKGTAFEKKVREDLEKNGWVVCRFDNQVVDGKLTRAKPKFNPFTKRVMNLGGGFPDFVCFKKVKADDWVYYFDVKFVECKIGKYLDAEEKAKCRWIIENLKIPIEVAYQVKEGRRNKIVYEEAKY
jgi:hypothetical protein